MPPWLPCFLRYQIHLSYYCRSPNDHFFQIVFVSDHWFKRQCIKFLTLVHKGNWPFPLAAILLRKGHFCQIIMNSGQQLQKRRFLKYRPLAAIILFLQINFSFSIYVEGYHEIITVKNG